MSISNKPISLSGIRHIALDMDGTIYKDNTLFPYTPRFLKTLNELNIGYTFLTNNNSISVSEYILKFQSLGLKLNEDSIYTSSMATHKYIQSMHPLAKRLFIIGTDGMQEEFRRAGYHVMSEDSSQEPELVIVGFDTALTFDKLSKGAYWIKEGKPFIATHPDRTCPTDEAQVLVDCGSVCAALEVATGISPEAVPGKPNPMMLDGILQKYGLHTDEVAMVGDRLYTDIAMAKEKGVLGILVLTGETQRSDLELSDYKPDIVVNSIDDLRVLLKQKQVP